MDCDNDCTRRRLFHSFAVLWSAPIFSDAISLSSSSESPLSVLVLGAARIQRQQQQTQCRYREVRFSWLVAPSLVRFRPTDRGFFPSRFFSFNSNACLSTLHLFGSVTKLLQFTDRFVHGSSNNSRSSNLSNKSNNIIRRSSNRSWKTNYSVQPQ